MNKKILKLYAVPIIYALAIIMFGTSMIFIQKIINNRKFMTPEIMEYVSREIVTDNEYIPVVNQVPTILRPYLNGDVKINKTFYNYEDEPQNQENSLIYYENTYMKSTGTYYKSDKEYDILSIYDGTVTEIKEDNLLGNIVRIDYGNNIIGVYGCIDSIKVKVWDNVFKGDIIAKSSTCKVFSDNNGLYFELIHDGININPELYYLKKIEELD